MVHQENRGKAGVVGAKGQLRQIPSPPGLWRSHKDFILGRCHQDKLKGADAFTALLCLRSPEAGWGSSHCREQFSHPKEGGLVSKALQAFSPRPCPGLQVDQKGNEGNMRKERSPPFWRLVDTSHQQRIKNPAQLRFAHGLSPCPAVNQQFSRNLTRDSDYRKQHSLSPWATLLLPESEGAPLDSLPVVTETGVPFQGSVTH